MPWPDALVGKPWHDLAGRKTGKFGRVAGGHDAIALFFAEFAGRIGMLGQGAAVVADRGRLFLQAVLWSEA